MNGLRYFEVRYVEGTHVDEIHVMCASAKRAIDLVLRQVPEADIISVSSRSNKAVIVDEGE